MCTVTVVPTQDRGFRLVCNRDERHERPIASEPQLITKGRRTFVCPIDPAGGGTWVGVNDTGLTVALLNRSSVDGVDRRGRGLTSRGLLAARLLAGSDTVDAVVRTVGSTRLEHFAPFTVVAVARQQLVALTSDGVDLALERCWLAAPRLFTSSSLGDERVEGPRRRLFGQLLGRDPMSWLPGQDQFHRHRWPERPEISVLMARADAATVSRSTIDVTGRGVRFRYEDVRHVHGAARVA